MWRHPPPPPLPPPHAPLPLAHGAAGTAPGDAVAVDADDAVAADGAAERGRPQRR